MMTSITRMEAQTIAKYIHTFLDLVENMPNDMSRHLTQLHQLNHNYLILINKMDVYMNKLNANNTPINDKIRIGKRIESILIQMQELADEKLRYAQNIVDLTESKTKELDTDYDAILYVNRLLDNSNLIINNNNNKNISKMMSTNGGKNNVIISNGLTDDEKITLNGESNDSKQSDKRLLPRRACALKTGDTSEPQVIQKIPKRTQKSCQRKYSTKSANFQLAMTKIYRDMALRRAKLPIKKQKSVSLSYKRNTNRKSVAKYKNRSIVNVRPLSAKHVKSSNAEQYIGNKNKANSSKKSLSSSSSTLSQSSVTSTLSSTTSSSVTESVSVSASVSASTSKRNNNKSVKTSSSQSGVNREKKRASNHIQIISNSNSNVKLNSSSKWSSKKSKIQNDDTNYGMFVGEPIDPNEPRYCLCDQVSYGEMICCDNQSCSIEWFHFNCVELEHKPKGKWFCPNCRGDRSNVPKK